MPSRECTVVVPLFNEEAIVEQSCRRLLEFLGQHFDRYEVILGSNGSTDRTPEIIGRLEAELELVRSFHLEERAPGTAFAEALRIASCDNIVSQDVDLSVDLEFIPLAVGLLEQFELVIGCKRMRRQKRSLFRKLGSNLFIFSAAMLLGTGAADYSIGAKAYRRSFVLEHLDRLDAGTAYVLELVFFSIRDCRMMVEVPVECEDHRRSRFNLPREAAYKFLHLARFAWQHRQT